MGADLVSRCGSAAAATLAPFKSVAIDLAAGQQVDFVIKPTAIAQVHDRHEGRLGYAARSVRGRWRDNRDISPADDDSGEDRNATIVYKLLRGPHVPRSPSPLLPGTDGYDVADGLVTTGCHGRRGAVQRACRLARRLNCVAICVIPTATSSRSANIPNGRSTVSKAFPAELRAASHPQPIVTRPSSVTGLSPASHERNPAAHRSMTRSLLGCEQQTRTLPSVGLSSGSGP